MEKFDNLKVSHLTLSPSVKNEEGFRTKVQPFIINYIETKKAISFYSISEEKGEGHHHLDIILFHKSDIKKNIYNNKGKQIGFRQKVMDLIKDHCPDTDQRLSGDKYGNTLFWNHQDEDPKKDPVNNRKFLIGYNFKEGLKNYNNLQISDEDIGNCLDYYSQNKVEKIQEKKDSISLNPKNAMYLLEKYIVKNKIFETENNINDLIVRTIKDGYDWICLSKGQCRRLHLQLKIKFGKQDQFEEDEINNWFQNNDKPEESQWQEMSYIRSRPRYERLKYLREQGFITKEEYQFLTMPIS